MDHARHLASPSPTSSFLFHHSERPFKTSLLTPSLLSSASDVNHVDDDCFSLTTTVSASNQTNLQDRIQESYGDNHDDRGDILVDHDDGNGNNHNVTHVDHGGIGHGHQNHCAINPDSLNNVGGDDDDDDDGMHNMLSGSSTSSNTTISLLTDNHSHHPFSRISLSEYSPLSLVDDCDNALTISPTSLVCGSHHPFKSSLNNLNKLENMDGVDVHVDDVVNDARSMSPSMMSAHTSSNQNQLWSISSTAITPNPSLLNSSATSFLLSHHHNHQLSSLMQQLEPQSLDEPPPLMGHGLLPTSDHMSAQHHRPSSVPLPGLELVTDISATTVESKPTTTKPIAVAQASATKSKTQSKSRPMTARASNNAPSITSSKTPSRKSRSKSSKAKPVVSNKTDVQASQDKKNVTNSQQSESNSYSCKAHLNVEHQKKLQELQQRLFGTATTTATLEAATPSNFALDGLPSTSAIKSVPRQVKVCTSKQTTTQSAASVSTTETDTGKAKSSKAPSSASVEVQTSRQTSAKKSDTRAENKPRTRPAPKRKPKSIKNEPGPTSSPSNATGSGVVQRSVTAESVEPDTTTKSSDCIKLADLLSSTSSIDSSAANSTLILSNNSSGTDSTGEQSGGGGGVGGGGGGNDGKRIQHIQLQVTPSLKFMTNGNLVQSMSMQQQLVNNFAVVSSNCATFNNQVICRPVNVMTSVNGNGGGGVPEEQLKCNILPGNDWLKSTDVTMLTNCATTTNPSNSMIAGTTVPSIGNGHPIAPHQIAIQVICQDGTSLVLPVSASSTLSAALASTSTQPQQQSQPQLQAVLTNNTKSGTSQQRHTNQILPLISVSNILAQQSSGGAINGDSSISVSETQSSGQSSSGSTQATGLAASSPTLAALLDTGTSRGNNLSDATSAMGLIASSNLLSKFVNSNSELKRNKFNLQPGTQIGLTNNGSLVTICTNNNDPCMTNPAASSKVKFSSNNNNSNTQSIGDKRIKLENVTEVGGNIQTTFTLIEPQGLIVANGNDGKTQTEHKQLEAQQQQNKTAMGFQTSVSGESGESISALQQQLNPSSTNNKSGIDNAATNSSKQGKMTSSTGNRQVDPTQPFRCEHCNSTFTRLGNFTRHKKIHSAPTKDGQRFKCEVCSKSFLQRCDLARHLHIHRGTEPHRCNICGKGYIRHSDLVTHQRFHNKEKPFGCPNCHKGFCQRGDLNRHLRSIHLQLKPLLCPCCNRKFAKRDTLLKHISTHHRGYPIELLPP